MFLRRSARATGPSPDRCTRSRSTTSSRPPSPAPGCEGGPYSAHSLRAGFVTYAHLRGASDRAIAHQTRHRSLATLGTYVRIHDAWDDNAATMLGL